MWVAFALMTNTLATTVNEFVIIELVKLMLEQLSPGI